MAVAEGESWEWLWGDPTCACCPGQFPHSNCGPGRFSRPRGKGGGRPRVSAPTSPRQEEEAGVDQPPHFLPALPLGHLQGQAGMRTSLALWVQLSHLAPYCHFGVSAGPHSPGSLSTFPTFTTLFGNPLSLSPLGTQSSCFLPPRAGGNDSVLPGWGGVSSGGHLAKPLPCQTDIQARQGDLLRADSGGIKVKGSGREAERQK